MQWLLQSYLSGHASTFSPWIAKGLPNIKYWIRNLWRMLRLCRKSLPAKQSFFETGVIGMSFLRSWQRLILGLVFLALIGMQLIESTHHHVSKAGGEACAVCQFVSHQPLNTPPPIAINLTFVLLILFILTYCQEDFRLSDSNYVSYFSRAPPPLCA